MVRAPDVAILSTGDELVDASEAPAPHQVRNAPDEPTIAVSMNYVDGGNLEAARAAARAAPSYHPKWLARLKVHGRAVPGSRAPWYARQRIALASEEEWVGD